MPEIFELKRHSNNQKTETITWVDLDSRASDSVIWLKNRSGLSEQVAARLLEQNTLNQHEIMEGGLVLCFYSRNLLSHSDDGDLIFIRLWIKQNQVISVHSDTLASLDELKSKLSQQHDWAPLKILTAIIDGQIKELERILVELASNIDELEDQVFDSDFEIDSGPVDSLRRKTILARRHLVALRNLLLFLDSDESLEVSDDEQRALDAVTFRVRNYLEVLDDLYARAQVLRDQTESEMNARLNRITYNLTIVATVFLPMSFLTGLLGMNVAGIPDEHNPYGFILVCTSMLAIAIGSWVFLRWRRWI